MSLTHFAGRMSLFLHCTFSSLSEARLKSQEYQNQIEINEWTRKRMIVETSLQGDLGLHLGLKMAKFEYGTYISGIVPPFWTRMFPTFELWIIRRRRMLYSL